MLQPNSEKKKKKILITLPAPCRRCLLKTGVWYCCRGELHLPLSIFDMCWVYSTCLTCLCQTASCQKSDILGFPGSEAAWRMADEQREWHKKKNKNMNGWMCGWEIDFKLLTVYELVYNLETEACCNALCSGTSKCFIVAHMHANVCTSVCEYLFFVLRWIKVSSDGSSIHILHSWT